MSPLRIGRRRPGESREFRPSDAELRVAQSAGENDGRNEKNGEQDFPGTCHDKKIPWLIVFGYLKKS